MKKLLVLTRSLSITEGQGRYAVEMIKKLANDFQITVFTSERPGPTEKDLANISLEIHDLPEIEKLTKIFVYFWYSVKLLPYALKADLIHFFSDYPYCTFFSFMPKFLKHRFITVHGTYGVAPLDDRKSRLILERAFRVAEKIICVSSFTQEQILKRLKLKNIMVINNGINLEKFLLKDVPIEWLKPRKGKIILSVGNLKNRKGYHISIPAVAKVKKIIPNLRYYIVGTKPDQGYYQKLRQLVKENDLEQTVSFLENLTDQELLKLYYQADLFLLTPIVIDDNKFEGFGLVYLEASACGKPVIGTKDCGAEDAIKDGYSGILVEQNNIEQTAEVVIKILSNPALAKQFGENGKSWAQKFNWNKIIEKYKKVYENIN